MTIERDCEHCGKELLTASTGRRKRFCSDACRKGSQTRHFRTKHSSPLPSLGSEGLDPRVEFAQLDRAALGTAKRKSPVDLMSGGRQGHIDAKIRAAFLETEVGFVPAVRLQVIESAMNWEEAYLSK